MSAVSCLLSTAPLWSRHRGNNPEKLEPKGLRTVTFNDFVDPTSKNPLWLLASRREGRGEKRRAEKIREWTVREEGRRGGKRREQRREEERMEWKRREEKRREEQRRGEKGREEKRI